MRRGQMIYVPPIVIEEVEDILKEDAVSSRADAFKEMTKYAKVGREVNRMMKLDLKNLEITKLFLGGKRK